MKLAGQTRARCVHARDDSLAERFLIDRVLGERDEALVGNRKHGVVVVSSEAGYPVCASPHRISTGTQAVDRPVRPHVVRGP
jgi:hypothetical protein